ncbi:MAG: hypothetical protein WAQ33_06870 [Gaiellaceae bacterium]
MIRDARAGDAAALARLLGQLGYPAEAAAGRRSSSTARLRSSPRSSWTRSIVAPGSAWSTRVAGTRRGTEYAGLFEHPDLAVQPGAGHFPWLDDTAWFTRTLAAFSG